MATFTPLARAWWPENGLLFAVAVFLLLCPVTFSECATSSTVRSKSSFISTFATSVNSSIAATLWVNGLNNTTTNRGFILMADGSLFQSLDGGNTLTQWPVNDTVVSMYQSADGSSLFFLTPNPWLWVSNDFSQTWMNISMNGLWMKSLAPHPTNASLILGMGLTECCALTLACVTCHSTLLVSSDTGHTWTPLKHYVYFSGTLSFSWIPTNGTYGRSVAFVSYPNPVGDQRVQLGDSMNIYLLSDFASNTSFISQPVPNAGPYAMSGSTIAVARISTSRAGLDSLMASRDEGVTWQLTHLPPVGTMDVARYWLESTEGNPFLGIFIGPDYTSGWLLVSPGGYSNWTVSLGSLVQRKLSTGVYTHFIRISSVTGTYIVNSWTSIDQFTISSLITFDHGANWIPLSTYLGSSTGVQIMRPYVTSSHFHAVSNAPGLIIAAGSQSSAVYPGYADRVWLSRDAGRSWSAVITGGRYFVRAAGSGSVLVAVPDMVSTTSLLYSLNFGQNWNTLSFSDTPQNVTRLWNGGGEEAGFVILIEATSTLDASLQIFSVDFSSLVQISCNSVDDFETFPLLDAAGDPCVLGFFIEYTRVKNTSICQQQPGQATIVTKIECMCTIYDFTCSYCFQRNAQGQCDYMYSVCNSPPPAPANCSGTFVASSNPAYVQISDSSCIGGVSLNDFTSVISCPPPPLVVVIQPPVATLQNDALVTAAAISFALCGIVIAGLYFGCRNYCVAKEPINFDAWLSPQSRIHHSETLNDVRRSQIKQDLDYTSELDLGSSRPGTPPLRMGNDTPVVQNRLPPRSP